MENDQETSESEQEHELDVHSNAAVEASGGVRFVDKKVSMQYLIINIWLYFNLLGLRSGHMNFDVLVLGRHPLAPYNDSFL